VSLRFFCDHCVPREIADALRQFGCHVELLRDHLPTRAPDADVIEKAQNLDCILVSLNGDFADIVAYRPEAYGGIVAIQLHDHPETIPALMAGFGRFIAEHPDPNDYPWKALDRRTASDPHSLLTDVPGVPDAPFRWISLAMRLLAGAMVGRPGFGLPTMK
jgi:predicted nuclease of predicted toxin-antitoxin system